MIQDILTPGLFARTVSAGRWKYAKHLQALDEIVVAAITTPPHRLLASMPPRSGKSWLLSRYLPAWHLGMFPDKRVMLCSYESDFAASWGRQARQVLEEHGHLFPVPVRVSSASSAADRWDIEGREGGMVTAGVEAGVTGKGANLLLIDDPIKDNVQAQSKTYRDRAWDFFRAAAYTRLEPNACIIVVQTRWHEDDLTGRIRAEMEAGGEQWRSLVLPALAEADDPLGRQPGEALWPERYPVDTLHTTRRTLGPYLWASLYQQHPVPAEGALFKADWLRYWHYEGPTLVLVYPDGRTLKVNRDTCRVFVTSDLATSLRTSADYTVICAWAATKTGELILLDMDRRRCEGPDIVPAIRGMMMKWGALYCTIESVAFQLSVVQAARRAGLLVRALKRDKDKVTRAIPATVLMESEKLWLPQHSPHLAEITNELLTFPASRFDDIVDNVADAVAELAKTSGKGNVTKPLGFGGQGSPRGAPWTPRSA